MWVLGDENNINIFKDPWLACKFDFRVKDQHNYNNIDDEIFEYPSKYQRMERAKNTTNFSYY